MYVFSIFLVVFFFSELFIWKNEFEIWSRNISGFLICFCSVWQTTYFSIPPPKNFLRKIYWVFCFVFWLSRIPWLFLLLMLLERQALSSVLMLIILSWNSSRSHHSVCNESESLYFPVAASKGACSYSGWCSAKFHAVSVYLNLHVLLVQSTILYGQCLL